MSSTARLRSLTFAAYQVESLRSSAASIATSLDVCSLARAASRHAGHFDRIRTTEELWNDEVSEPVAGGWPLVDVDTTKSVDVAALACFAREM